MNEAFFPAFFNSYFIAFGVVIGGSLIGGMAAFVTGDPREILCLHKSRTFPVKLEFGL